MFVNPIKKNLTEIVTSDKAVLVSYQTPVAARVNGEYLRTDKFWSITTSKHINHWLHGQEAEERPQSFFDGLI